VSFAAITLCVASQRVFVVVYFVIDSVRKLLDTTSYIIRDIEHLVYAEIYIILFKVKMNAEWRCLSAIVSDTTEWI
jgi:hypothetical protein